MPLSHFPNGIETSLLVAKGSPNFNVVAYGADRTGLTDSTAAIQAAIDAAEAATALSPSVPAYTWITEVEGGVVYLPRGWYRIDSKLTLKNRVSLVGESMTSTGIVAGSGYSDAVMIDCVDGTNAIFDSRIQDIRVHANNDASITSVIHAQAWQELCGLIRVSVAGYQGEGILIEDVSSGSARLLIQDCWFAGFSTNNAAIHIESTVPNAMMVSVIETTIDSSGLATNGIHCENGRLYCRAVHIENATNGIHMEGGSAVLDNITGNADTTNLITVNASFGGTIDATGLDLNGGTLILDDNVTSRDVSTGTGFHFPFSPQSASATPSVALRPAVLRTFYSGTPTTITDFTGGPHEFILRTQDANTTIDVNGNANINRADGVDTDYTEAAAWFHVWDDRGTWIIDLIN